jgi:hypothetical protein
MLEYTDDEINRGYSGLKRDVDWVEKGEGNLRFRSILSHRHSMLRMLIYTLFVLATTCYICSYTRIYQARGGRACCDEWYCHISRCEHGSPYRKVEYVCWRMLTHTDVCWRMLTYADVCWLMLTYADVCWRILTYGDVCWRMERHTGVWISQWKILQLQKVLVVYSDDAPPYADVCWRMMTYADVYWRTLTYADVDRGRTLLRGWWERKCRCVSTVTPCDENVTSYALALAFTPLRAWQPPHPPRLASRLPWNDLPRRSAEDVLVWWCL